MAKSKIEEKTIKRAQNIIAKFPNDDTVYYKELKKSYEEYQNLVNIDKTTKDLYLNHINDLTNIIMDSKNSNRIIISLIIVLFAMFFLTSYSTIKYYQMSKVFNKGKSNINTSLVVNYDNLKNFDAYTLSSMSDYKDIEPLIINLSSMEKSNDIIHYNVYIIEQNDEVAPEKLLNREVFLYNVKSTSKDSGIKDLKNNIIKDGKILIYSGDFNAENEEKVEIRMWLDSNIKDYLNKTYRYKLYVEGYIK